MTDAKTSYEEKEELDAQMCGYRSSKYHWFGKSVPSELVGKCISCGNTKTIDVPSFIKVGLLPEVCSNCNRKALLFYDKEKWERYLLLRLWEFDLFLDQHSVPYVAYQPNGVRKIFPLNSSEMKALLSGRVRNRGQVDNSILYMEGLARRSEKKIKLHLRVAKLDDGIWIDLSDEKWRAIHLTKEGWEIVEQPPIIFRRWAHMAPMVVEKGTNDDLKQFVALANLASTQDIILYEGYLASMFIPDIDHPILMPVGPQGAAKTTITTMTRLVVDPSELTTMDMPEHEDKLPQMLSHHYLPAFDNCGYLKQEISDVLCRACTGAGFTKRKLYSDDDDIIFSLRRGIVINGISAPSLSPDLIDRSIVLSLERIDENFRREKSDVERVRDALLPKVRGYLLDCLVATQSIEPFKTDKLPRMADFARITDACMVAMGYTPGEFIQTYMKAVNDTAMMAVESDPLCSSLLSFLEATGDWNGSATDLLHQLNAPDRNPPFKSPAWPKDQTRLSHAVLGRLKPGLALLGWMVGKAKANGARSLTITKITGGLKPSS